MAVKITKPSINIREKLSELDKPAGIAGEAMLRAETPQEQFNLIGAGRKNLIINGDFDIWQRGTSSSVGLTNQYGTADRWSFNTRSCTTKNISQQSFSPGQTEVVGNPSYFLRAEFSNNSGSTGPFIMQRIEDVTKTSGQFITTSFYAKSASGGELISVGYSQQFGTGGSPNVDVSVKTFKLTSYWKKYSFSYKIPSVLGLTIGTNNYLRLDFKISANTAITFDLAQVQVELGKVATPFEHRSYAEELQLCERYYQIHQGFSVGKYYSTNLESWMEFSPRVPMRVPAQSITIEEFSSAPLFTRNAYAQASSYVASNGSYSWNSLSVNPYSNNGYIFHGSSSTVPQGIIAYAPNLILAFDAEI